MYYSEGYGRVMVIEDDHGNIVARPVENVYLLEQFEVDTGIRPVVDSSPGQLYTRVWDFDTYKGLDTPKVDMLY